MPQLNQRGFVTQLLILLLLVAGIGSGVYLVKSGNLKLFSRATNPPIVFKSLDGKPLPVDKKGITQTTSPNVRVELTSTLGPPVSSPGPVISRPIKTGTVAYRAAFNPADLKFAPFVPYLKEPTVSNIRLKNTRGTQFYWVEFKATDGKVDRRSAQIEIVFPVSKPTCKPRPACLDMTPACKIPEPTEGWCLSPTPGTTGYVQGVIRRLPDNDPVAGATVSVVGLSTTTKDKGEFRIDNVSSGSQTVTATKPGYFPGSQTVTVPAGGHGVNANLIQLKPESLSSPTPRPTEMSIF